MSEKRRDTRNRILRVGESQRPDGRYRFKYKDIFGKEKNVYSNRLDEHDPIASGAVRDIPLREKEKQIEQDMFNELSPDGGGYTVYELAEKYISLKTGVRQTTKIGYKTVLNVLKKDPFGSKRIDKVKQIDAKAWIIGLQKDESRGFSSIHTIRGVLRPAFQMAYSDDLIKKNPFDFGLATVIVNDSVTREALNPNQEREFLRFVAGDSHYKRFYDAIYILFNTGLRISEFCGLTLKDIDFKQNRINVDHQLQRIGMEYIIQEPKTEKGNRFVPMTPDVAKHFHNIIRKRKAPKVEPMVGGLTGFLYLDKNNEPMVALHWEKYFQAIVRKYNTIYKVQMPTVTPHVCRHTFCSKMARSGMNPKMLQYIMGHSDISVTLNTYTHVDFDDAEREIQRILGV